ncbi:cyclase family protein [Peptacetobacter hiranonis]|uniref:cyclase family protein n=1 Tax=Peptacetobacter hiranonis TaxID=89152 RepID=UPI0019170148|nr:cyclase family protein [Peptacetobacter hiranonis]QQQ85976.1 cyclase family protein [Peptacetobacter hiranonis]
MKVIDLTYTIKEEMTVFPGTEMPKLINTSNYEKDGFRETSISIYSHVGTHMDPPAHIYPDRTTLDEFPASQFVGKGLVIDCRDLNEGEDITLDCILKYGKKAEEVDFLLFNTGWDKYWGTDKYFGDYPCVNDNVLDYVVNGNYKGIGFDTIGIDPVLDENLSRHKKLFKDKDIVNIENLKNLELCGEEIFKFSCCPLKIENSDGAPVRAIAWFE